MKLYTHLNFGGNCADAFRYYEQQLGGKITMLMTTNQAPGGSAGPFSGDQVIHARLEVAGVEMIGNDVPADYFRPVRSSCLYLALDSDQEADRIWNALMDGGQSTMPMTETFFAGRFGQVRDRFGVLWTIIHPRHQ